MSGKMCPNCEQKASKWHQNGKNDHFDQKNRSTFFIYYAFFYKTFFYSGQVVKWS
jgi:hypothetical protein